MSCTATCARPATAAAAEPDPGPVVRVELAKITSAGPGAAAAK